MTEQARDKILLSRLGFYLDGWADMVEGMGGKATDVRKNLITELKNRKMPEVEVEAVDAQPVLLSSDTRPYNITTTSPGATTTIYVGQHGHDLYTSWRVFLKPILNKDLLLNLLKIAGVVGGLYFGWNFLAGFFRGVDNGLLNSNAAGSFGGNLYTGFLWGLGITAASAILVLFFAYLERTFVKESLRKAQKIWVWILVSLMTYLGRVLFDLFGVYKSVEEIDTIRRLLIFLLELIWYPALCAAIVFFLGLSFVGVLRVLIILSRKIIDWADSDEKKGNLLVSIFVITMLVFSNPIEQWNHLMEMLSIFWAYFSSGLMSITFAITIALYIIGGGLVLMILGGLFIHKSAIYYFLVQPNLFDADDITAMTISVHNSLLRVLDNQGIDVSKLRLKQKFTGGRKGEDI